MVKEIRVPQLDVNSDFATFVNWCVKDGLPIRKGNTICVLETSKATYEIDAEDNGYLFINKNIQKDDRLKPQSVIAIITDSKDFVPEFSDHHKDIDMKSARTEETRATKKALKLIEQSGLDIDDIWSGQIIKEKDVIKYIEESRKIDFEPVQDKNIVIIGAGKGGEFISQILAENYLYNILGFIDSSLYSKVDSVCGYKILGSANDLWTVYKKTPFFNIALSISADMNFRHLFYQRYSNKFNFINIIHPQAFIEKTAKIGKGNFVGANTYVGCFTMLGNNCWIASGCIIEHHNIIGDSCLLGPSVSTSGSVNIGKRTIIGAHCCFIPKVKVGENCIINSGTIVTSSLRSGAKLKIKK